MLESNQETEDLQECVLMDGFIDLELLSITITLVSTSSRSVTNYWSNHSTFQEPVTERREHETKSNRGQGQRPFVMGRPTHCWGAGAGRDIITSDNLVNTE